MGNVEARAVDSKSTMLYIEMWYAKLCTFSLDQQNCFLFFKKKNDIIEINLCLCYNSIMVSNKKCM